MFGQDEVYEWWALPGAEAPVIAEAAWTQEPSEARFIPIYEQEASAIDAAVQAQSTGSFFDTIKSVVQTLSPLASSIIKATTGKTISTTTPTTITSPGGVTTKPLTAGFSGLLSNPLVLGGAAIAAFMFLKGRGKGKRRR